ncbi:MAG TPA: helicase-related protein, partial [Terrimicrobiaceae bacterium]|nr:helicase-related protein [Terrimicrobiaceae bacterium]
QRDRNAAWFAKEDGAQILLCSEIGSEGRNFQFAHHLVLFDLPANPGLLEQRIGRLDRIGQTETISIHVPYPEGSRLERLARWYHAGLNAFEKPLEGAGEIERRLGKRLSSGLRGRGKRAFDTLITETAALHARIAGELRAGEDRLLEINSFRPDIAAKVASQIAVCDRDRSLDDFMLRIFDHFGVQVEELSERTYLAVPARLTTDAFPELPEEGLTLTCDRAKALAREEIGFLTWDHPIVTSAVDLLLGSGQGNSAFAVWAGGNEQSIYLEVVYVLEPVAPPALHADRFLPPTPLRIVVDPKGADVSGTVNPLADELKPGSIFRLLDNSRIKKKLLPEMLEKSRELAGERAALVARSAVERMQAMLGAESSRLRDLQKSNDHVRDAEIEAIVEQRTELAARIAEAPLRLDALRLIWRVPADFRQESGG